MNTLNILLIQGSDIMYYNLHIVTNWSATYISYVINSTGRKWLIKKVREKIKNPSFKFILKEKWFNPDNKKKIKVRIIKL